MPISSLAKRALHSVGLNVTRYHPRLDLIGIDSMSDVRHLLDGVERPVVFDVGAHAGDTVEIFRHVLPTCELHAFEPGPATFKGLEAATGGMRDVHLVNAGVGAVSGRAMLIESDHSNLSSFLPPGEVWGHVVGETPVEMTTLDDYCLRAGVDRIHLLKSDTQGYDFEVLKGAATLMSRGAVQLVLTEVIFSRLYEDIAPFDEMYRLLRENGFRLVAFYNTAWQNERASWCDALFALD
jgi:FkbM family methyltransferase